MDDKELFERLIVTFLEELEGHVQTLSRGFVRLEAGVEEAEKKELLASMFRAAHSLKGAAQAVSVDSISIMCHAIEEVLASAQAERIELTRAIFPLLFNAVDAIGDAGRKLAAKEKMSPAELLHVARDLRAAAEQSKREPPPAKPAEPVTRALPTPERAPAAGSSIARVPLEKLDQLLSLAGELLVARMQLAARASEVGERRDLVTRTIATWPKDQGPGREAAIARIKEMVAGLGRDLDRFADELARDEHRLQLAASLVEDQIRRVRMVPFGEAEPMLERTVREAARARGIDVELVMKGRDVDVDRAVFDRLRDPLVQLTRNAVFHGGESPRDRLAANKQERNRITVAATLRGPNVEIAVEDDGSGLDLEAIRARATERGVPIPAADEDLAALVFLPSISTSPSITHLAGRGVGLDVVKTHIEALHGSVRVKSTAKIGTRFVLTVPITLTTIRALLASAGGVRYAFATSNVVRVLRIEREDLKSAFGREVVSVGDSLVPIASLAGTLEGAPTQPSSPLERILGVVVTAGARRMVFAVDQIEAELEIVAKPLGTRPLGTHHFSGASVLPGGEIALIINASELMRMAEGHARSEPLAKRFETPPRQEQRTILIADDSVTTRLLATGILEGAGFEVLTAADGVEALRILNARAIDLVLADVEMPHMDGVQLTETIRSTHTLRDLPVILLTALESDMDRTRGLKAGANAYLIKRAFDQRELIETIESIAGLRAAR